MFLVEREGCYIQSYDCGSVASLNIIDNMLETMEKYGQTLEQMIAERTEALYKEKSKTDKLLYSLMPRYAFVSPT